MSAGSRQEYLEIMQKRYRKARHKQKGALLDEIQAVTGLERKSLIRLMGKDDLSRKRRSRERGRTYGCEVQYALDVIAESFDYICSERLHGNLTWMAHCLAQHGELVLSQEVLDKLARISVATIRRLLQDKEKDEYYLPRSRPKPSNPVAKDMPMRRIPWNESQPGPFEVDLVRHCGDDPSGEFACTLPMVDVASGWSEFAAILGKSQLVMADAFQRLFQRLPLPVLELHPDNGGEFLNFHLLRLWRELVPELAWSRSRPYNKNDNRLVEQKNCSLIRHYLGYQRLDTVEQVKAMNQLYGMLWLYYNLFQPVLRLQEKQLLPQDDGSHRVRYHYGQAQTPYQRACALGAIPQDKMEALQSLRNQANPRTLRVQIYELADAILRLPRAQRSAKAQDVHLTLAYPRASQAPAPVTLSFDRMAAVR